MAYSDAEYSDNESVNGIEDSEYECEAGHVDGAANVVGNSEDDIDDATLVKSFKILRRMTKQIASGIGRQGVSTRSTVDVSNVAAGPSKPMSVKANSRCNQSYFKDVIMALNDHQKQVVTDYGFGDLLQFDGCPVPRRFVQWIADHIDEKCHDIHVNGEVIPLTALSVHNVLGTALGGNDISDTGESGKMEFLELFDASTIPTIKTFGSKILLKEKMSDDQFFRCFMVVALSTFLCPNSSTYPSPKYLKPLVDLSTIKQWDWSKFILERLLLAVKKYVVDKRKTLGGCIYFLAVFYLDHVKFGPNVTISNAIPRISVWKGSMVKKYSSIDCVSNNVFGKRPIKKFEETCYANVSVFGDQYHVLKRALGERFAYLPENVINGICGLYECFSIQRFAAPDYSPDQLVIEIFQYLQDEISVADNAETGNLNDGAAGNSNQEDPHHSMKNNDGNEDANTEKLDSDGDYQESGGNNICSQATVVVPSQECFSEVKSSGQRKRKRNTSSPESTGSVASRTRRRLALNAAKSPLSRPSNVNVDSVSQGSKENPVMVDESVPSPKRVVLEKSIKEACDEVARKHEEYNCTKLRQSASVNAVSSKVPVEDVNEITRCEFNKKNVNDKVASEGHRVCSASKPPPAAGSFKNSNVENAEASKNSCPDPKVVCHGKTVAADFHEKDKFTKKAPYFNSPSVPSFRFFDDEDDMGNYVEDVNLRRPVGCSGIPTPTNSASTSSHHSSGILPKGSRLHERVLSAYKLPKANVEHNINPEASQSTASNNNSHDKFAFEDYLIMESLSNTDDETNEVRDVSGPYSAQPIGFLNNDGEYVILSQGLEDNNDVTITGERTAKDKLSAMCHDSDQYYDNSIGTSDQLAVSGSSSGKLANHRARRVHVRSRYQVSPYMNERPKICLTNREKEVYDVVLQLSRSDHDNELAVLYKHVKVTFNSLGSSLGPNGKVQTFVVNAYCKYLFDTKHPRESYKHFFFTKVSDYLLECYTSPAKEKELRDYAVKSFNGANSARKLYNSNLLYFPIFYRNHWLLIVVDLKNRCYLYLEPDCANYGPDSAYHRQMKETFAKNFFAIWEQTVQLDCGIPLLKGPYFVDVPQQLNENDGGVFILKLLEVFEPNVNLHQKFTQVDIRNIRKKFVNEMIFAPKNEMVDSVELVKTYKPEVYAKYFAK
ncbi:hypothetical protein EJB05_36423 [Eragrostis curvula]|uniref:Ubiquitin-like protease family profile domain-containing protein n=1 Tax=Eragrostis curvula TaxID=38414 RepID=A0A5J9U9P6_9POAL|nr:hypothetical protein EJB05_36423 [Eragrostis curvula]